METPVARLVGALLLLGAALYWNPANPLWIAGLTWLAFAVGAYLVTQAMFALFLTLALVTGVHLFLYQLPEPTHSIYAVTAAISTIGCGITLAQRFRARIHATREERWKNRS